MSLKVTDRTIPLDEQGYTLFPEHWDIDVTGEMALQLNRYVSRQQCPGQNRDRANIFTRYSPMIMLNRPAR